MFARARYKYPAQEQTPKPCPLDLSEVPMNLPPIPSDRPGSASRFKGVYKNGKKWRAQISIPSEGGINHLGTFDSEEEAGIMYARARYKYPAKSTAAGAAMDDLEALEASSFRDEDPPVNAPIDTPGTSDTTCMVCGLSSDPFLVLLCDGCENEAHLACVGLSHVPEGEWFCSSCHPRRHDRTKAAHPTKPASQSHDIRRKSGELDEIDGIMIEAFADDDAEFRSAHE